MAWMITEVLSGTAGHIFYAERYDMSVLKILEPAVLSSPGPIIATLAGTITSDGLPVKRTIKVYADRRLSSLRV